MSLYKAEWPVSRLTSLQSYVEMSCEAAGHHNPLLSARHLCSFLDCLDNKRLDCEAVSERVALRVFCNCSGLAQVSNLHANVILVQFSAGAVS